MRYYIRMVGINSQQGLDGKNTEPDVHRIMESERYSMCLNSILTIFRRGYIDEELVLIYVSLDNHANYF